MVSWSLRSANWTIRSPGLKFSSVTRIAGGASNRLVAQQMFISEKTVSRHLANIYAKLEVSSRTAAVAWAHQNNLLR